MTLDEATRRLERWTQSLLDRVPRDRLVDRAETDEVHAVPFDAACAGAAFDLAAAALAPTGDALDGEHPSWLAIGVLWWERGDARVRRAPVLLAPVAVRPTADGRWRIERLGAPRPNTALVDALRREGEVELRAHDLGGGPRAALDALAADLAVLRPAWAIERAAYVVTAPVAAAELAADLGRPELAGAPLVRRLLVAEPIDDPPVGPAPALPLDADAEQLAVVAAALAGHSLAVLAPPGTGAAQTAANLVSAAIALGKTVLVVSDRVAALRRVRRHLAAAGVGEFALDLALVDDGARVAAALAAIADRSWRPGGAAVGAIDRRDQVAAALDAYARALHAPTASGITMFDAVARLVELRTSPRLPASAIDLADLDPAAVAHRRGVLVEYSAAATAVAPIAAHPWRGSTLSALPGDDPATVGDALGAAATAGAALAARLAELARLVPGLAPRSRAELEAAGALFAVAARTPRPGGDLIAAGPPPSAAEVRVDPSRALPATAIPRDPAAYVALARRQRKLADELARRWRPALGELELETLAGAFRAAEGKGAFGRWAALRGPRAVVRAALAADRLPDDRTIAADLALAAEERAARRLLGEAAGPARRWFGQLAAPRGAADLPDLDALDLDQVDAALWWARDLRTAFDAVPIEGPRDAAWRALIAQVCAPHAGAGDAPDAPFAEALAATEAWRAALAALVDAVGVDRATLDGDAGHLPALAAQIAAWQAALAHLPAWTAYVRARTTARVAGLAAVVTACESGALATEAAALAWERAILLAVIGERIGAAPALAQFHGPSQHARAVELGDLTRAAQLAVRSRTLARLADRVPRQGQHAADDDLLAAIRAEASRPAPGAARDVLALAGPLAGRLAPVVLATPAAVAAHLAAGGARFDLAVVLEAGALPAAASLGVLARANAVIAFGVPREGSLLAEARGRFAARALTTHYASRHEELFAFANRRWFGDALVQFPAAGADPGLGIRLALVDGDAADAVVAEVAAHARDPERRRRSLAVVAFTSELVAAVNARLVAARARDPELDGWLGAADAPPVVVEARLADGLGRDVVVVAVDAPTDPDELAVAVTRAREQMIVVSTVAPEAATGELAELLAFARGDRPADDAAPASPLAAAIGAALGARGWAVRHRVGAGPYRIDLAVIDPDEPTRYVLGIETDGAAYGGAAAAGDRDRLRGQVLAARGWRLHRIWCLDWWTDPEREAQRANGAVIAAIAAARQARRPATPRVKPRWTRPDLRAADPTTPTAVVEREPTAAGDASIEAPLATGPVGAAPRLARGSRPTAARSPELMSGLASRMTPTIAPYQAASVPAGRRRPDDMFEPKHAEELGRLVERVLEVEAPIQLGLLARRVGAYFGVGKVTPAVAARVREALVGRARTGDEVDVVWRLDQDPQAPLPVRVAAEAIESRRDIDEVPLLEIASAAQVVVERAPGVALADLVRDAARLLGFARITDRVATRVRSGVELAGRAGAITVEGDRARRG